jgi:hypothetical protein
MTKERPILFSAPMVRALLAGTKTQTRRVVKGRPLEWLAPGMFTPEYVADPENSACPYGQPGDRLWVRETWQVDAPHDGTWHATQWYGCKGSPLSEIPERFRHPRYCNFAADWLHGQITWRPSIHMPRWASRITLEITGVRVERLQEITIGDCIAEGIVRGGPENPDGIERAEYRQLWEQINSPGSWDSNPWVWCLTFRRLP